MTFDEYLATLLQRQRMHLTESMALIAAFEKAYRAGMTRDPSNFPNRYTTPYLWNQELMIFVDQGGDATDPLPEGDHVATMDRILL